MFVKVCGVKNLKELEVVERYANATGVVVKAESKRAVSFDVAREITSKSRIPVFVVSTEFSFEGWVDIIKRTNANCIQVHSDMNEKEFEKLRRNFDGALIKAFLVPKNSINPEQDAACIASKALNYDADYFLLDTGKGSGKLHDLRVSREVARMLGRVILAGGLNPANVAEIVEYVKPFGVDVSSGVEINGSKDAELIKAFVEKVRR